MSKRQLSESGFDVSAQPNGVVNANGCKQERRTRTLVLPSAAEGEVNPYLDSATPHTSPAEEGLEI